MMHSGRYHGFFAPLFEDSERDTVKSNARRECSEHIDAPAPDQKDRRLRLLILGGYGSFGGRIAELLSQEPALSLMIAGRSRAKAEAFCAGLPPGAHRQGIALDRDGDLQSQLEALEADIVIDATGPFQAYGADPYRVVKAAIAAGVHYLDLADGSQFVRGIAQFDDTAKERGVAVVSGVSSFPVLTAAAVRALARGLAHVESITGGIAPSPYAGYGRNVIRAIAGYAGKPVALRRDGREGVGHCLAEMRRYTVAPPGRVPLRPTEFSLVDVPDLLLLADLWPEVRDVWFGAGPVPAVLHRQLRRLAGAVARGWIASLEPLWRVMFHAVNRFRWGEDRGGMFVEVAGRTATGVREVRSWHLVADGADGPYIPSMAIAAIVTRWLAGLVPVPGARPATQALELSDYQPFFDRRRIYWGQRREADSRDGSLFRRLLGDAFDALPKTLQSLHDTACGATLSGSACVTRGRSLLARLAADVLGLPAAGCDVPVSVTFERTPRQERWTRHFGGRVFSTTLFRGEQRYERLLCERFGPFVIAMAPVVERERLSLIMRGCSVLGLPLPRALTPCGNTYEFEEDGRFRFHVEIELPLIGPIIRYEGCLEAAPGSPTAAPLEHEAEVLSGRE